MKTMILTTLMILTATSAEAAKECSSSQNKALKAVAMAGMAIKEKVIDDRIEINRTGEYKQLDATGVIEPADKKTFGTGFLVVDSCHVLTNHHVAFNSPQEAKLSSHITFSVGQTGSNKPPFKKMRQAGKIIGYGEYTGMDSSANKDWAVVRLDTPISKESISPLSFYQMPVKKLVGQKILNPGFPGNRTGNGDDLSKMYGDTSGEIVGTHPIYGFIYFTSQTSHGQSGAPIAAKGNDGKYYAIGMVDHRMDMTRSKNPNIANIGVSFSSSGDVNKPSEGDKILKAIAEDNAKNPCN